MKGKLVVYFYPEQGVEESRVLLTLEEVEEQEAEKIIKKIKPQ